MSADSAATADPPRPCERQCPRCNQWLHHSRFHSFTKKSSNGSIATFFKPICRSCEQKERNESKNADRPASIINDRAVAHARKAGSSKDFFMVNLNYRSLIPILRATMTSEGLCTSCGHPFVNERDTQIEHREPPRHPQDWARLHARNLGIACQSCNGTKSKKSYSDWLDEQELARLANVPYLELPHPGDSDSEQMELW